MKTKNIRAFQTDVLFPSCPFSSVVKMCNSIFVPLTLVMYILEKRLLYCLFYNYGCQLFELGSIKHEFLYMNLKTSRIKTVINGLDLFQIFSSNLHYSTYNMCQCISYSSIRIFTPVHTRTTTQHTHEITVCPPPPPHPIFSGHATVLCNQNG